MASRSEKFARKFPEKNEDDSQEPEHLNKDEEKEEIIKFSPEEEIVCELAFSSHSSDSN